MPPMAQHTEPLYPSLPTSPTMPRVGAPAHGPRHSHYFEEQTQHVRGEESKGQRAQRRRPTADRQLQTERSPMLLRSHTDQRSPIGEKRVLIPSLPQERAPST